MDCRELRPSSRTAPAYPMARSPLASPKLRWKRVAACEISCKTCTVEKNPVQKPKRKLLTLLMIEIRKGVDCASLAAARRWPRLPACTSSPQKTKAVPCRGEARCAEKGAASALRLVACHPPPPRSRRAREMVPAYPLQRNVVQALNLHLHQGPGAVDVHHQWERVP